MAINKTKILAFVGKYKVAIGLVLILMYLNNISTISSAQKEASSLDPFASILQSGATPGTYKFVQTGGVAAGIFGLLGRVHPVLIGISAALLVGPWLITNWVNIFRPEPTIPSWIWIGAFLVIIILVLRKK